MAPQERSRYAESFGHLLEPGETVRSAWLLFEDSMARVVCLVTDVHYYIVSVSPSNAGDVLLFGPLGVEARVWRPGRLRRSYLVIEERRLPLRRGAGAEASALIAALGDGS